MNIKKPKVVQSKSSKVKSEQLPPKIEKYKPSCAVACSSMELPGCVLSNTEGANPKRAAEKTEKGNPK